MTPVGALYDPEAGVLGTIPRLMILLLIIAIGTAIIAAIMIGVVAVVEWWDDRHARRARRSKDPAPVRVVRLPEDPYVVKGTLGGKYEIWNVETGEVVATESWAAEAARVRAEYATRFYREQREARDAVR